MANELSNLSPRPGSRRNRMRLGRGEGSGKGKTAGRGQKGQRARGTVPIGFEGGQMPLHRRLPKRGFNNIFAKQYNIVSLGVIANAFEAGVTVTLASLKTAGIVSKIEKDGLKVLAADEELTSVPNITAAKISKSAQAQITAAGGTFTLEPALSRHAQKAQQKSN